MHNENQSSTPLFDKKAVKFTDAILTAEDQYNSRSTSGRTRRTTSPVNSIYGVRNGRKLSQHELKRLQAKERKALLEQKKQELQDKLRQKRYTYSDYMNAISILINYYSNWGFIEHTGLKIFDILEELRRLQNKKHITVLQSNIDKMIKFYTDRLASVESEQFNTALSERPIRFSSEEVEIKPKRFEHRLKKDTSLRLNSATLLEHLRELDRDATESARPVTFGSPGRVTLSSPDFPY